MKEGENEMKKLLSLALASTMMLAVFAGCGAKEKEEVADGNEAGAGEENSYVIGYAINSLNDTGQTLGLNGAEDFVATTEHKLVVSDASEDVIKQQDNVSAFIEQGVNALVVVPVDTSAMDPITDMAVEAGIPLVYVNRNPYAGREADMPTGVYYVGSQEIDAGIFQAEFAGEHLGGKGGVAILQGILGNEGALKRTEGVQVTLAEKYPEMVLLAAETGNWQRDQGMAITENWITKFGDELNAVLANNDEMALGAINALKAAGREDVIVMGVDAIPDARASVQSGEMIGTVLQDQYGQGAKGVELAIAHLDGAPGEAVTWIPFELVTKENIADYID